MPKKAAATKIKRVDTDSLTLREIEDIETHCAKPFGEISREFTSGNLSSKTLTAFVWVSKRRDDPSYTLEQAYDVKLGDIISQEDDADPPGDTPPAGPE